MKTPTIRVSYTGIRLRRMFYGLTQPEVASLMATHGVITHASDVCRWERGMAVPEGYIPALANVLATTAKGLTRIPRLAG